MKTLIDLDDNVKAAIDDYYSGKISHIGLDNGFKLLEAVKNGTSFSGRADLINEIKQKIEQEEYARAIFRNEEKDENKANQCTGSIMAYKNVLKMLEK